MCNEKFFILITMQLAWYTIGISHSFYSHHVCLIASVALALVLKGRFTSDRVGVIISSIQLYDLVKTAFWFRLWLHAKLGCWSRKPKQKITKQENMHCDWFILLLLLPTPTIWFSLDLKWWSHKCSQKKMETFWYFLLQFQHAYDSAYNSNFWFSQGQQHSCDYCLQFKLWLHR